MDNKTLFITGGAGFIGSNFINIFCKKYPNTQVINFDALYYCADENNVDRVIRDSNNYKFIHGNLQSFDLLKYIFESNPITHIIHFAAQSHVQTSFTDSIQYTKDNVLGTHNLLEVTRLYCPTLERFIHCSTDEVYGESMLEVDEQHKTEQSVLCPTNPYAASKAAAEMIINSYNESFKSKISILRANNIFGPRQNPEKIIPHTICSLIENKKINLHGSGQQKRCFLHINDFCKAVILIIKRKKHGEIYNIGSDQEIKIETLIKLICTMMNKNFKKSVKYVLDRPFNDFRYNISYDKMKKLGWTPKLRLKLELVKIIDWYKDNYKKFN